MPTQSRWGMPTMNYTFETMVLAILAFAALLGAGFAYDSLFAAHMWVAFFVLLGGTVVMLRHIRFAPASAGLSSRLRRNPSLNISTKSFVMVSSPRCSGV